MEKGRWNIKKIWSDWRGRRGSGNGKVDIVLCALMCIKKIPLWANSMSVCVCVCACHPLLSVYICEFIISSK